VKQKDNKGETDRALLENGLKNCGFYESCSLKPKNLLECMATFTNVALSNIEGAGANLNTKASLG
jgi:hypothetical protein